MAKRKSKRAKKNKRRGNKARKRAERKQLNLESLDPRIVMDASGALAEVFETAQPITNGIEQSTENVNDLISVSYTHLTLPTICSV